MRLLWLRELALLSTLEMSLFLTNNLRRRSRIRTPLSYLRTSVAFSPTSHFYWSSEICHGSVPCLSMKKFPRLRLLLPRVQFTRAALMRWADEVRITVMLGVRKPGARPRLLLPNSLTLSMFFLAPGAYAAMSPLPCNPDLALYISNSREKTFRLEGINLCSRWGFVPFYCSW